MNSEFLATYTRYMVNVVLPYAKSIYEKKYRPTKNY